MKVLVACEESQAVTKEFRRLGHEAYSCDLQEPSGGHPEWHIYGDALVAMRGGQITTMDGKTHDVGKWDMLIAHPPCTYLTNSATRHYSLRVTPAEKVVSRWEQRARAAVFFMLFYCTDIPRVAIENPVGFMNSAFRKPDQIIHPYHFGHPVSKKTCLWLKGLSPLKHTEEVEPELIHSKGKSGGYSGNLWYVTDEDGKILSWKDPRTAKARSKTYPGIAKAMAEQWGGQL